MNTDCITQALQSSSRVKYNATSGQRGVGGSVQDLFWRVPYLAGTESLQIVCSHGDFDIVLATSSHNEHTH